MNKKIIFLTCLLMVTVWTAGCACPGPRRPAPAPVVAPPPPPPPQPEVAKPKPPVEEYCPPSKKLKERVYY
jgi:hypothetical protein